MLTFPSVASTSIIDFQLIVDLFLNPYLEGVEYIRNISCNKLRQLIVEYILSTNSEGERFAPNTLQTSKLIIASIKAAVASTFFNVMPISISHSEGARAPLSMLIVRCDYSKISFHFCEDCRIFREGVKGNGIVEQKLENKNRERSMSTTEATAKLNDLFGHNALVVWNNVGPIGLIVKINHLQQTEMSYSTNKFQLVVDSIVILNCEGARAVPITISEGANAVPAIFCNRSSKSIVVSNSEGEISKAELECFGINGKISLVGLIGLAGQIKCHVEQNNELVNIISLIGSSASFAHRLISLIGLIGLIGLGDLCITSLVGSSASSARQLIGLIGFVIAAKTISRLLKKAVALGVATLQSSATKIVNVAFYYFASSSLHVCLLMMEKMLWWLALARKKMWWWIASLANPTTVTCYNLENNYFVSGFRL